MTTPIHYVIGVHGIGVQKPFETVLPITSRVAEARRGARSDNAGVLTIAQLGAHASGAGVPWFEFADIPNEPTVVREPFTAAPSTSGENMRFVECYWADLLEHDIEGRDEPAAAWAGALIRRMEARGGNRAWALEILREFASTLGVVQTVARLKAPTLAETAFNHILGDVYVYGDYLPCRGRAVRRFHELMADVLAQHQRTNPDREAAFTIIAHSLGSVLALDALMFAHALPEVRSATSPAAGVPYLPDYISEAGGFSVPTIPNVAWLAHVRALVTLGSPIDKYLTLWSPDYEHLLHTGWMNPVARTDRRDGRARGPIPHYNYCDEQDPVGEALGMLSGTPAAKIVFGDAPQEERVFNRYIAPGVAHVQYWSDTELFAHLVGVVIDGEPVATVAKGGDRVTWFSRHVYVRVLVVAYLVAPAIGWAVITWLVASIIYADGLRTRLLLALALGVAVFLVAQVTRMLIQWRQVVVSLRKVPRPPTPAARVSFTRPDRDSAFRGRLALAVRITMAVSPFVWLGLLGAGAPGWIAAAVPASWLHALGVTLAEVRLTTAIGLVVAAVTGTWVAYWFFRVKARWRHITKPTLADLLTPPPAP